MWRKFLKSWLAPCALLGLEQIELRRSGGGVGLEQLHFGSVQARELGGGWPKGEQRKVHSFCGGVFE